MGGISLMWFLIGIGFGVPYLMLGVGVGFDVKGAGEIIVKGPNRDRNEEIYMIMTLT